MRIVYVVGSNHTELPRNLDGSSSWDASTTTLLFELQADLAAGATDNTHYELYFKNPSATNPLTGVGMPSAEDPPVVTPGSEVVGPC